MGRASQAFANGEAYRPAIFKKARVDQVEEVSQADAEEDGESNG